MDQFVVVKHPCNRHCPRAPSVANANVNEADYVATYTCYSGYRLVSGNTQLRCPCPENRWIGTKPTCSASNTNFGFKIFFLWNCSLLDSVF